MRISDWSSDVCSSDLMAGGYGCRRPRMAAPSFTLPSSARSWRTGMAARKLVHIVDDEHAIRRSTSFMLQTAGYAVRTWPTAAAFLKAVRQAPEGCVLLDIRMPDMEGIAVQQRLVAGGIALPVIVLTGHAEMSLAVQART